LTFQNDSKNGAWDALPQLVDMTHALSDSDREMVAVKLDKSAVFYTLARLEALHAGCHGLRPAKHHQQRIGQLTNPSGLADAVARVDHAIQYMRKVGAVDRERMPAGAGGEWSESAKASYEEPAAEPLHLRGDNGERGLTLSYTHTHTHTHTHTPTPALAGGRGCSRLIDLRAWARRVRGSVTHTRTRAHTCPPTLAQ
jgi:hypothetical protein